MLRLIRILQVTESHRPLCSMSPQGTELPHQPLLPIPSIIIGERCSPSKGKIIGLQTCSSKVTVFKTKETPAYRMEQSHLSENLWGIVILVQQVLASHQFIPLSWTCSWAKILLSQAFSQDFLYFLFLCEPEIPWEWPSLWYFCTSTLEWR